MKKTRKIQPKYPVAAVFVDWLNGDTGRAAYFHKVDPGLFPSMISKLKSGILPITFEYAVRLERAQKASDQPLRAEQLATFQEARELLAYVRGKKPAPAQLGAVRRGKPPTAAAQAAA